MTDIEKFCSNVWFPKKNKHLGEIITKYTKSIWKVFEKVFGSGADTLFKYKY